MQRKPSELLDRKLPADLETERRLIGCLLIQGHGKGIFDVVNVDVFDCGKDSYHGWLFTVIRSAMQSKRTNPLAVLVSDEKKREAAKLGVSKLACDIGEILTMGCEVIQLPKYIRRLKDVATFRGKILARQNDLVGQWRTWTQYAERNRIAI